MNSAAVISQFYKTCKGFDGVLRNITIISAGKGNCLAELKVAEEHTNHLGTLHGGLSATIVDSVSSLALSTHENVHTKHVSVDIQTTYLKSAKIGETIEIDARTLRAGKTIAFLEVFIRDKNTKHLLVKGTHTKFMLK